MRRTLAGQESIATRGGGKWFRGVAAPALPAASLPTSIWERGGYGWSMMLELRLSSLAGPGQWIVCDEHVGEAGTGRFSFSVSTAPGVIVGDRPHSLAVEKRGIEGRRQV